MCDSQEGRDKQFLVKQIEELNKKQGGPNHDRDPTFNDPIPRDPFPRDSRNPMPGDSFPRDSRNPIPGDPFPRDSRNLPVSPMRPSFGPTQNDYYSSSAPLHPYDMG